MATQYINLIDHKYSEIDYNIFKFNDGEPHIKFTEEISHKNEYIIIARITNSDELLIVLQVGDILERHGVNYSLYLTYLMGMRMDRVMTFNEAYSLNIISNILKLIHPVNIYIFEPHSQKTLDLLNAKTFNALHCDKNYTRFTDDILDNKHIVKCYPDHGAWQRYGREINVSKSNYIILDKKRDINTGNIIGMKESSTYTSPENKPIEGIIIIDDLCDGGRTFIEAKKLLNELYPGLPVYIFVKHMVNIGGLENLMNNFDHVYITNSYREYNGDTKLTVFNSYNIDYRYGI